MKSACLARLLAIITFSVALGLTACVAQTRPLPKVENVPSANYRLTSAQESALAGYIQGRYRRIKATVEKDRAKAHQMMSAEQWFEYTNRFHPNAALPKFKRCMTCSEFGIRITRVMSQGCSVIRLELNQPGDLTCHAIFEFETIPVAPENSPVRKMATKLSWRPRDIVKVPPHVDVQQAMRGAISDIVVTGDDLLVRRRSVASCLGTAAVGKLCQ